MVLGTQLGSKKERRPRIAMALAVLGLVGVGFLLRGALYVGPEPVVEMATDRPAVGPATRVQASFREPRSGLGVVRLELIQGDHTVVLAQERFRRPGPFALFGRGEHKDAVLAAVVGRESHPFLGEGELLLRAVAEQVTGPFRSRAEKVVETRLPVRFRPPRLTVLSAQHYVRQGGSGVVVFSADEHAVRAGVRTGEVEHPSWPLLGGGAAERFSLYGIPWDLEDGRQVKVFAEDAAGNRAENPFLNRLRPFQGRRDTIQLPDAFLERVVPAIAAETPELEFSGSLLEQYLLINGELRRRNLAAVADMAEETTPEFLWSGPFVQLPNSQRRAGYGETRDYIYRGQVVDRQTHLGLDLASVARAPVPAANAGRVVFAGWLGIYGNTVVLDHGYGLMSLYGHLTDIAVMPGDMVGREEIVGRTGITGLAGGDHLHLEIFVNGISVDPIEWLDGRWIRDTLHAKLPMPGF